MILAGVALATLTGEGSIIGNAENAVGQYNNSVNTEQQLLNEIEKYFIEHTNEGGDNPPTELPEEDAGLAKENVTIKPDPNSNVQIVIPNGFAPAILATGTLQSGPGEDGSVKEIMPEEEWSNITVEDINKGIVIVDHAITYDGGKSSGTVPDFNEYVWVPIPDINKFERVSWNGKYRSKESGGDTTGQHPLADEPKENYFWEDITTNEYKNMLKSVENNKGFYIGRYESSGKEEDIAQSKRNQSPWNHLTPIKAMEACDKNTTENIHLIYGIEWDSTLNWLKDNATISSEEAGKTKTMTIDDIQTNSGSWGNYYQSTGDAVIGNGQLRKTGYIEFYKSNNIYDLAGNCFEWTQERCSANGLYIYRGGYFVSAVLDSPAAYRAGAVETSLGGAGWRFPYKLFCLSL